MSLTLQRVHYHADAWFEIGDEWAQLCCSIGNESAFASSAWLQSWWLTFGPRLQPEILIWRNESGVAIGATICTVMTVKNGWLRLKAAFLGPTGDDLVATEHGSIIAFPEREPEVLEGLVKYLRGRSVQSLRLHGFVEACATRVLRRWNGPIVAGFQSADHYVDLRLLRGQGIDYVDSLSRNTRSQIRRSVRLYEEQFGAMTLQVVDVGSPEFKGVYEELLSLHGNRWATRSTTSTFLHEESQQFHTRLFEIVQKARRRASQGDAPLAIRLLRIRAGRSTVGVLYCLLRRGVCSFYQSGFHYQTDSRLKPGLVSHAMAIQHHMNEGFSEYDFLAGDRIAARYKRALAPRSRKLVWLDHSKSGWTTMLLHLARAARNGLVLLARSGDLRRDCSKRM